MKILVATGIYPPSIGGPATYSKLLFDELPTNGHLVKVLSFDEVRHLPKVARHFSYFLKVLKLSKGVDIVYAQDPVSVGLPALIASRLMFKKFVLKVVGDYAWEQGSQRYGVKEHLDIFSSKNKGYPFFVTLLKKIQTFVAQHADKVIVPSNYLKKIITRWGVNPHKIAVIYNSFENFNAPNESRDWLRRVLEVEGTLITSVGRLVPWKGFRALIEVIKELQSEVKDIKLLIIGDGPEMQSLQKSVRDLNLEESVFLAGRQSQSELFKYIKASDIFVLNTQYEGFSHQLLEVMYLGTPIITTDVGGNSEAIDHSVSGLLVKYNDKIGLKAAILSIIKLEGEGKKLALAAQEKVKMFTKERMVGELTNELLNVLKKRDGK